MSLKQIEKIVDDKVGNTIITVEGKHHYPILNEGVIDKINEIIEVVNEQSRKIEKIKEVLNKGFKEIEDYLNDNYDL